MSHADLLYFPLESQYSEVVKGNLFVYGQVVMIMGEVNFSLHYVTQPYEKKVMLHNVSDAE